jgi:two-component system cell cycle sensor histidine kinase/response regulator CckA
MPPQIVNRIFDPFFTTKDIGKGTGLGLATASTILKSHGGFINVYSEPNKGTQFSIYLPSAAAGEERQQIPAEDALPTGNGELILIVDDEENIRSVAEATLTTFGYRTVTAVDGTDALAAYSLQRSDIVLTDMSMPHMDGASLIRVLKKMNSDIKVIAMSGLTSEGTAAKLKSLKVDAFLSKPFSAETLLKTVSNVIRKR